MTQQNTPSPEKTVTHDIVAKLWNLCNVLKDDGVTYHQYVIELTYLLFLKMATRRPALRASYRRSTAEMIWR